MNKTATEGVEIIVKPDWTIDIGEEKFTNGRITIVKM